VKVKTVTLYGPSNVKEWGSYSKSRTVITKNYPCSPCRKTNCIRNLCMEAIKAEEVLEAVKCGLE
jgi:ADP-heptose:LPS heptosyltransferase